MSIVNMLDAKTNLSRLVDALERGDETEVVIARNGKPVARLTAFAQAPSHGRIGALKGASDTPAPDPEIERAAAALMRGETP
ncbi:MAG: type II toxin-antitoxin system Phd/YefM family antitoxin [Alphaproteobacteria bacterium]|nr:type II toxin-antitoxin system Phd/YefM family antitoxin [Alphaproteobacteria bacterium]